MVEFPPVYTQAQMLGTCDEYQPNSNIEKFHQVFITTLDIMLSPINPTVHMLLPCLLLVRKANQEGGELVI